MNSFSQIAVTSECVADFCQELEHRLTIDNAFVDCLCSRNWKTFSRELSARQEATQKHKIDVEFELAFQKTQNVDLSKFIKWFTESYTAKIQTETEWYLTWSDIWLKHAHEKNGFKKIVRECEKINKARAKAHVKEQKEQAKAEAKAIKA